MHINKLLYQKNKTNIHIYVYKHYNNLRSTTYKNYNL